MKNILLSICLGLAAATPAAAQTATRLGSVHYDVVFDSATAASRTLKVTMSFDVTGPGPVRLSLPVWTPGAYEVTYFAKNILSFEPTANGRPLDWDKASYSSYRINTGGARKVRLEYTYRADELDNAKAWSKPDFLLVNGTNIFFYPEGGSLAAPATVSFHTQPGWKIATAMHSTGANYREENFHDLVDMPVFIGAMDFDSVQANGKWYRLASYPAGNMAPAARATLLDEIARLAAQEAAVFGEEPWQAYTTMIIWDSAFGGYSALEHQRSHVGIYNAAAVGNVIVTSVTAHEMFHAWNVKRMRPSEMWPYRYGAEQPTPWLWVSEGITDYYADLALARAGLGGADFFYNTTAGKIATIMQSPPVALEDASLSTWIHPVDGTGYLYYPKGSLAGFMLDIMIRDASDNARSLDTVMREVYRTTYQQGRGFTAADWWGAVSRAAGGMSFTEFNRKYIDGREPYPWDRLLPLAGMRLRTDTVYDPRLGISVNQDADSVFITEVTPGSAAAAAGLQAGDVVLSVGDVAIVASGDSFEAFRTRYRTGTPGSDLAIVIRRAGQQQTLTGKLRLVPRTELHLEADPAAGPKAVRIREALFTTPAFRAPRG